MNSPINISNLRDPNDPKFVQELKLSFMNLTRDQEKIFFHTLLSHFDDGGQNISYESGHLILAAIYKFLIQPSRQINFQNYILQLPFSNSLYLNSILNILYALAERDPNIFSKEVANKFKPLIKQNPHKCLVIIALLASNFEIFDDPWPMIDLLFSYKNYFTKNCAIDYMTVLITLCKKDIVFLEGRGAHCWSRLCHILNSNDEKVLQTTYHGLSTLIDLNRNSYDISLLPQEKILIHLQIRDLQPAVVSFFLRVIPSPTDPNIQKIIEILLRLSEENVKPTLILIRLATDLKAASFIIKTSDWLSKQIPTQIDTIRLLMAIMKHEELRPKIMNSKDIIYFLKNSIPEDNSYMGAILMILRRLPINENFVNILNSNKIIQLFIEKANSINNEMGSPDHINTMIVLFDTFSKVEFNEEPNFDGIVDFLSLMIKQSNDVSLIAVRVAAHFAIFPNCAKRFKKKGIDRFIDSVDFVELQKASKKLRKMLI